MPEKTLEAFADHGEVLGDVVTGKAGEGRALLERLGEVGVDFDDVMLVLETEGVDKFKKSWDELVETVQGQMDRETGAE
jgi:transaldolase